MQAEVNIGVVGHVDHGKTSVVKAMTGVWTDTHSEEVKRGITIKLGYADAVFRCCEKCGNENGWTTQEKCLRCGGKTRDVRRVSFLDAPGHETLMTTVIAASSIIDGALLVIGANEACPCPQTLEHLMVLEVLGVKHIVVAQNKIDLVSPEKAKENYEQIRKFLSGSIAEKAPIIPVAANYGANLDLLVKALHDCIPVPHKNPEADFRMYVARSFDVNKPGADLEKLSGGVVGGSLIQGKIRVGDEIESRPGFHFGEKGKEEFKPVVTTVKALFSGKERLEEAVPGGLIAIGTTLDPALTKSDFLVGNMVGKPGTLPEPSKQLQLEYHFFDRPGLENPPLKENEPLVVSIGTSTSIGFVEKAKKNKLTLVLKRQVCVEKDAKVAISRKIGQRWRLSGYAKVK
ncbi:translation initiation factor IF-2 subunit gamma [Candidatus Micrarchaeota archaeon]|nr:translation initiation factor IF-2 subunit gamma [Candidatus Micrarchaeota archaeon]